MGNPEPPGPILGPIEKPIDYKIEEPEPVKSISLFDKYKKLDGQHGGQCVEFIQMWHRTHPDFRGIARDIKPNATEPQIGGVVITSEGIFGHVALIIDMTEDYLIVAESNLNENDEIIRVGRRIYKDREYIVGYFNF